jgi:hypothetical protein
MPHIPARTKLVQTARRRVRTGIEPRVGLGDAGKDETEEGTDSDDIWARLQNVPAKADLDRLYTLMVSSLPDCSPLCPPLALS